MVDIFSKQTARIATKIGKLTIQLTVYEEEGGETPEKGIHYQIVLKDVNGNTVRYSADRGNLRPYLTENQITTIETFLDNMKTKAAEMLT